MLKKIRVLGLMLFAASAMLLPKAAQAQDGYYGHRDYYYRGDGDGYHHDGWRWRDGDGWRWNRENRDWREHEWREHEHREHEWREHQRHEEHEWREHHRWDYDYQPGYYPGNYYYFEYGR